MSLLSSPSARCPEVAAVVLAGGEGRRLGQGEKALVEVAGRPLVEHVIARIAPQVDTLAISANRQLERYRRLSAAPLLTDAPDEQGSGPLAGIARALDYFAGYAWVLTVPCDTPLLPMNLVERLLAGAAPDGELVYACDGEREHFTIGLWRPRLAAQIHDALAAGERRVRNVVAQCRGEAVCFADSTCFVNVNCMDELNIAAARLTAAGV